MTAPADVERAPEAKELDLRGLWRVSQAWLTPPLLLLLPVGLFGVFIVFPIIQSIATSFFEWDGTGDATWVGWGNYVELFNDPQFATSLKNNVIWLVLFMLAPVFGVLLALLLNQPLREMSILQSIFFVPLVLAHVIIGVVFAWFYDPTFGLLTILFKAVGLPPVAILSNDHLVTFGIIAAALWSQTAFCLVLFLAGLSQINDDLVAAGRMDGAHGWSLLKNIVLPQLRSVSFIATIITVIGSLRNLDLIAVMTQGGPYGSSTVLAYQMDDVTIFSYRAGYGAAIATVLFLIMSVFIALFLWYTLRQENASA